MKEILRRRSGFDRCSLKACLVLSYHSAHVYWGWYHERPRIWCTTRLAAAHAFMNLPFFADGLWSMSFATPLRGRVLGYSSVGFGAWLLRFFAGSCLCSGGLVLETRRGVGGGHWAEVLPPMRFFSPGPVCMYSKGCLVRARPCWYGPDVGFFRPSEVWTCFEYPAVKKP